MSQAARSKRLKLREGTPSLKRLQATLDAQGNKAQASATAAATTESQKQPADALASSATDEESEDVRIERELAKMKDDRLKAIQTLPRSVWS